MDLTRAAIILAGLGLVLAGMTGRIAYLQTHGRQQTIRKAERQQHQVATLQARRGSIFDRSGMMLAGTIQTSSLFIDPKFMQDSFQADGRSLVEMDTAIEKLSRLIDRDPYEISQLLGDRYESRFVRLADNLDDATCAAIDQLSLPGVGMIPMNVRYYPCGSIAAHVLGGMGKDGGLEGV